MREMKDSGIEWVGATPETWKMIPLKYLASYNDEVLSENTDDEFEFDYIEIGSVQYGRGIIYTEHMKFKNAPSRARRIVRKDDIIVSTVRTYLKAVATIPACNNSLIASTGFIVIRPHKVLPRFMNYALLSESFISLVESHSTGISYPAINSIDVVKFKIPVPCRSEQERIAAFLDAECAEIDAVLEKTRASIEEYKKLKQAVITQAVTKGIRGDRPMKDSGIEWIGDIPAEWSVVKGRRLILATQNGLTRRNLEKSEGFIVLKLKNLDADGNIDYSEVNRVALTDEEKSKYQLCDGDFLFVRVNGSRNLVGKCAIYHDVGEIVAYNDHIIRVKLNDLCLKEYFHYYLLSIAGKREIELHTSTAAGQFTISGDGLRELRVVLPGIVEQAETVAYLDKKSADIDALVAKKQQYLTEIENYKKSLIYEYVTGKKEVV